VKFVVEMKRFAHVEPQEGVFYLGTNGDGDDGFIVLAYNSVFGWMTSGGEPGVTDFVGVILPTEKH